VNIVKGKGVASILNGTYQAQVAYVVDDQRVTDYFIPSNPLTLFDHTNVNSSIDIYVSDLDTNFDSYELVLIATINEKTVARSIGIYSTRQNVVSIDYIDITLPVVPLADLTIITPVPDKSEAIFSVGQYALRVGPTTKFDFNYQPLANQIGTFWQTVEYKNEYQTSSFGPYYYNTAPTSQTLIGYFVDYLQTNTPFVTIKRLLNDDTGTIVNNFTTEAASGFLISHTGTGNGNLTTTNTNTNYSPPEDDTTYSPSIIVKIEYQQQ
jgi:hypothetical protein